VVRPAKGRGSALGGSAKEEEGRLGLGASAGVVAGGSSQRGKRVRRLKGEQEMGGGGTRKRKKRERDTYRRN